MQYINKFRIIRNLKKYNRYSTTNAHVNVKQ